MKNTILLSQSLIGESFEMLKKHISQMSDNKFLIFSGFSDLTEVCNTKVNYEVIMDLLEASAIPYETIKETDLDEYFTNNHDGEIYITPTNSISVIVSSAALLEYKGIIKVYGSSTNEPIITNIEPYVRAFKYKSRIGAKGLDTSPASYSHVEGRNCYFTINGKKYTQVLKGRSKVNDSGVEGYTMICEDAPEYRIKIWDGGEKQQYEIDKVQMMISSNMHHNSIAMPLTFVYNELNNPIGIVMKNFIGKSLDILELKDYISPLVYVKQLLEAMLWMESRGLLHRDVNHNILFNSEKKELFIIDVDSIQYNAMPATASSLDAGNALPIKYKSKSMFFNTIDISYTTMSFLISAYVSVEDFFGVWDNSGLCPINEKLLSLIKDDEVVKLIQEAYLYGKPVSLIRQLNAVNNILNHSTKHKLGTKINEPPKRAKQSYDALLNLFQYSNDDCGNIEVEVSDEYIDDVVADDKYYSDEATNVNSYSDDATNDELYSEESVVSDSKSTQNNCHSRDDYYNADRKDSGNSNEKSTINVRKNKDVPLSRSKWFDYLKQIILSIFMNGTVSEGMTQDDMWNIFIRDGKWKKPLITSAVTIVLIIVMLIAITQI